MTSVNSDSVTKFTSVLLNLCKLSKIEVYQSWDDCFSVPLNMKSKLEPIFTKLGFKQLGNNDWKYFNSKTDRIIRLRSELYSEGDIIMVKVF